MTAQFLALHHRDQPLLIPNPWDAGSAKILATLGFEALATTSSGMAAAKGRLDHDISLDDVLAHAGEIVAATDLPVSCDFENGFADDPEGVARNIALAMETGLAGASVEDSTERADDPIYEAKLAAERVAAAAEVAHNCAEFVLTARAENYLHGRADLADTIARLQSYQAAGADVLYAPGVSDAKDIAAIVRSVDRPVNVLVLPNAPDVATLAELGVKRISIGGAFAYVAYSALVEAANEFREQGTYGFWKTAGAGMKTVRAAFSS
jgi:2-methylisocitrate lyase-like PEP mutase family enzyme